MWYRALIYKIQKETWVSHIFEAFYSTFTVFALICLDHLPEKEKISFYHCNIPISDENVTCPNQKLLVRGDGQVVTAMTALSGLWFNIAEMISHTDLSFNNIEMIEGLEKLTKLQDLTLYNNRISRIENMDHLTDLHVFSLGNNSLTDLENVSLPYSLDRNPQPHPVIEAPLFSAKK